MLKVVGASWNRIRVSTWIIGIVFVLGIVAIILGELGRADEDGNWSATVYWSKESGFEIVFWGQGKKIEEVPKGVARAYYQCHVNTTGWAILDIETQPEYPDWVQAFGAGMLEGSLTWQMIHWQRLNILLDECESDENECVDIKSYLEENMKWLKQEFGNSSNSYWHQIQLFYCQLQGLQNGFEQGVLRSRAIGVEKMDFEDFLLLNAFSDMNDLRYKFSKNNNSKRSTSLTQSTLLKKLKRRSINYILNEQRLSYDSKKTVDNAENEYNCGDEKLTLSSAFVKLVAEEGKIYIAHNSAGEYSSMLKMVKHYRFHFERSKKDRQIVPGTQITFSSYPGVIHSMDDFYIVQNDGTNQRMVITGISLPIFNEELWQRIFPVGQILIGPRIMTANRLASNGREWAEILSRYNSGTANKEWIIVDLNKFETIVSKKEENYELYWNELKEIDGLLYVADQIPGTFEVADETELLRSETYWASYGLPYFEKISKISGTKMMEDKFGAIYSHENTPVAMIFRRDHENATDLNSVAKLMRSNSYKTDPLSHKNPRCAIGSRGDLSSGIYEAEPVGVIDTKIFSSQTQLSKFPSETGDMEENNQTGYENQNKQTFQVKAGPPYSDSWNVLNHTEGAVETDDLKPFDWCNSNFRQFPHRGHPDIWDFKPIIIF